MTEVCQVCGGRPERETCVCGMIAQVRAKLKEGFNLTDDELDEALDDGRLYMSSWSPGCMVDDLSVILAFVV